MEKPDAAVVQQSSRSHLTWHEAKDVDQRGKPISEPLGARETRDFGCDREAHLVGGFHSSNAVADSLPS